MQQIETKSYVLIQPQKTVPLVMDSPHSGIHYPDDFNYACPLASLRFVEDTHVDTLWSVGPNLGVSLLAANAPRSYIDCNRSLEDMDPVMVEGGWPAQVRDSLRTGMGNGLIWRNVRRDLPIYSGKLSQQAVRNRIGDYYLPYHDALKQMIDKVHQEHQAVWHLNLHSMPANVYERLGMASDKPAADFVLGDRDGTSCAPEFTELVEGLLLKLGYSVSINDPYKGQEIVAMHGQPGRNRHSLQVEIRRDLYMNEQTREPNAGFEMLRADLALLTKDLVEYVVRRSS
jgi:N-formylglutamate deformylase